MADAPSDAVQSQSTNGKVPVDQQPDTTIGTGVDEKINVVDRRVETPLPRVNINEAVTPGHDMVVNHVDGSQELAQGHVAHAVMAEEAKTGEVVSLDSVNAGPAQENPRTPDPETNGPDQQVSGQTADEVVAASQPDVNANEPTPAFPTPSEGEEPAEPSVGEEDSKAVKNSKAVSEASADAQDKAPESEQETPAQPSADDVEGV